MVINGTTAGPPVRPAVVVVRPLELRLPAVQHDLLHVKVPGLGGVPLRHTLNGTH